MSKIILFSFCYKSQQKLAQTFWLALPIIIWLKKIWMTLRTSYVTISSSLPIICKKHYSKTETCSAIFQGSRTCWVTHHLYYLLAQLPLSVKLTKLTGKKPNPNTFFDFSTNTRKQPNSHKHQNGVRFSETKFNAKYFSLTLVVRIASFVCTWYSKEKKC